MTTTREPIDALIEALDSQEQYSTQDNSDHVQSSTHNLATNNFNNLDTMLDSQEQYHTQEPGTPTNLGDNNYNNQDAGTPTAESPATTSRQCRLARILSSSSLKKRFKKTSHCRFCPRFRFSRLQMESHLIDSKLCLSLYLRHFKVQELDAVLLKIFRCFACSSTGTFQLKRHLGEF